MDTYDIDVIASFVEYASLIFIALVVMIVTRCIVQINKARRDREDDLYEPWDE